MRLSIIIPIHNSEKYLSSCLQCVFQQDLHLCDYEVIVINDGSVDKSKNIILRFQNEHRNLLFVDQDNKGVSAARNAGLDIAKGEYITFVDSDDEIESNSLKTIIEKLKIDNLDILYPRIDTYSDNNHRLGSISFDGNYDEIKRGVSQERRTFPATFYRRELLKNIRFNPEISLGEDTVFNAKVQAIANRVSFANIPYYKYTVRENSLSKQGQSDQAFASFVNAIFEIHTFQQNEFKEIAEAKPYFDKVYEIFVTRIIELNIIPKWKEHNYKELINLLKTLNLLYILNLFPSKYPYINSSFLFFKTYQKYLELKSKIYNLIHRA